MMAPLQQAKIVRLDDTNKFLDPAIPNLAIASPDPMLLVVVGAQKDWPKTGGATWPARIGLSGLVNLTKTAVGGTHGDVTIVNDTYDDTLQVYKITGVTAGRVKLSYSHQGITAEVELHVV